MRFCIFYPGHSQVTIFMSSSVSFPQGTFGREPQAKPEDDRYLRAAIQEYDNIAKLGQIMREGPIKVRHLCETPDTHKHVQSQEHLFFRRSCTLSFHPAQNALGDKVRGRGLRPPRFFFFSEKKNKE